MSAIASFFEHLIAESEDDKWQNPVHRQRHRVRMGHHLPRDVSDEIVATFLAGIEAKRDRARVCLMVGAGLRLSEVCNLRIDDCDLISQRLRVRAGKGNRDRVIPITRQLAQMLQAYLAVREPIASNRLLVYRQLSKVP